MTNSIDLRITTTPITPATRRCELCDHKILIDITQTYRCTRCGLISFGENVDLVLTPTLDPTSTVADTPDSATSSNNTTDSLSRYMSPSYSHTDHLHDALCAYQFILLSKLNGLLPRDVSTIVIDYMIWYRSNSDFVIGDRVNAIDCKNQWGDATVIQVQQAQRKLKVHFDSDGNSHKYDIWVNYDSNGLAPYGTYNNNKNNQITQATSNNKDMIQQHIKTFDHIVTNDTQTDDTTVIG